MVVAPRIRIFIKKQGSRTTSAQRLGEWGETAFFAVWFLLGLTSLVYLIAAPAFIPDTTHWQLGGGRWLVVLVVTSFILLGGRGLAVSLLRLRTSQERRSALARDAARLRVLPEEEGEDSRYPTVPTGANLTNSPGVRLPFRLPVSRTHAWEMLAAASFCLVWNGLTIFLLQEVWGGYRSGQPDYLATIAMLPFLAIGGWAIRFFAVQIVRQTRVGPTLVEISDHPLKPGTAFTCYVAQAGRIGLREFTIHLVCEEETTCHHGTDIRIDRQTVFNRIVEHRADVPLRSGQPLEIETECRIPPGMMHSFQSPHNAVLWKLVVRGKPLRGDTFEHPFPLVVIPDAGFAPQPTPAPVDGTTH